MDKELICITNDDNQITPAKDLNIGRKVGTLFIMNPTNQNSIKLIKVFRQQISYKTLGTSEIYSLMYPPSLAACSVYSNLYKSCCLFKYMHKNKPGRVKEE